MPRYHLVHILIKLVYNLGIKISLNFSINFKYEAHEYLSHTKYLFSTCCID